MTAAHHVPAAPGVLEAGVAARVDWDLLEAVALDTGQTVSVLDRRGRCQYMTCRGQLREGAPEQPLLTELYDPEYAAERLGAINDVASTGRPLAVIGMTGGRWWITTYRPLPPDNTVTPPRPGSLQAAVRAAHDGAVLAVSRTAVPATCTTQSPAPVDARPMRLHDLGPLTMLNQRELQVLHLIGLGLSSAEIARAVHRSVKAVEWYRGWIAEKLGLHDKADAVRFAASRGLSCISVERWLEVIARQPGGPAFEVHVDGVRPPETPETR
jgi:DNA-binding CsgD family transcriptional regulator